LPGQWKKPVKTVAKTSKNWQKPAKTGKNQRHHKLITDFITPGMGSSRTVLDLEDSSRTKMCGLGLGLGLEAHWPWPWPWP